MINTLIITINNTKMGKKIIEKGSANQVECIEDQKSDNQESEKKPLHKFLPHHKYIDAKTKIYKKRLSQAIKGITLNKHQIKKAVECLSKYAIEHNDPTDLTQKQDYVYVCIDVSKIPQQHSVRPIQIKLPYPIYSSEAKSRYTVITSDEIQDKFVETIDNMNVPMLQQVLSYNKIKKDYKSLKDKRELLAANDLFFCDWKVYNLLRQPLGKLFYEQKKYPFPIDCDGEVPSHLNEQYPNYQSYINGLANYTYTMMGNGPVYTIKVCKTKMAVRQQVKNIMHGSYSLIANLLDTKILPEHIRQISIKTYNSPSLPIYNHLTPQQIECYKK